MAGIDIAILCMNPANGNVVWETFDCDRDELEKAKREIRADPDLLNWSERVLNRHYTLTLKNGAGDGSNLYRPILLALAKLAKPDPDTRSIVGVIAPDPSGNSGDPRMSVFSVNLSVRGMMKDNDREALTGLVRQLERSIPDNAVGAVPSKKARLTDDLVSLLKTLERSKRPGEGKIITALAAAEKIVLSAEKLLPDLCPLIGVSLPDDSFEDVGEAAVRRFRERGLLPMPFDQVVLCLTMGANPPRPPITVIILGTALPNGEVVEFHGFAGEPSIGRWTGPYEFKVRIASQPYIFMKDTDREWAETARTLFHAAMICLLACDLPGRRVQAPGARPLITPRIGGRPVLAVKFRTVELLPPEPKESRNGVAIGERHAPAYHAVKAHDRHLKSGKVIRVKAHHRGDAAGLIDKIYTH